MVDWLVFFFFVISATCLVCCGRLSYGPLFCEEHFVLIPVWLKDNQSVCTSWKLLWKGHSRSGKQETRSRKL